MIAQFGITQSGMVWKTLCGIAVSRSAAEKSSDDYSGYNELMAPFLLIVVTPKEIALTKIRDLSQDPLHCLGSLWPLWILR